MAFKSKVITGTGSVQTLLTNSNITEAVIHNMIASNNTGSEVTFSVMYDGVEVLKETVTANGKYRLTDKLNVEPNVEVTVNAPTGVKITTSFLSQAIDISGAVSATQQAVVDAETQVGLAEAQVSLAEAQAIRAENALPAGTIQDEVVAPDKAWSSSKIVNELKNTTQILKPTITSPLDGAVDTDVAITITGSAYETSENFTGSHTATNAVFATDAEFTNIIPTTTTGLESVTVSGLPASTKVYSKIQYVSGNFKGNFSGVISFTTKDAGITTPTIISPTNEEVDLGKNVTVTTDAYSAFGHVEVQKSASYRIYEDAALTILKEENLLDEVNLTSWTSGNLEVSKDYWIVVRKESDSYQSGWSGATKITTKSAFFPMQGQKGFGIEPCPAGTPYAALGLAEMTGTNEVGHDNYGNYIHTNGSIACFYPRKFYRVGHASSPRFAVYGANALDIEPASLFADEAAANTAGYVLPRAFIDGGAMKTGYFRDKYIASKKVGDTNVAVSVKNGNPIGLTTNASYNPSSDMTGCTGILADAITLCRARGNGWNTQSAFIGAWSMMISIAQGQAATNTDDVAWYDETLTMNFPKGCNNGSLADVNDTSVTWTVSPDNAAKGLTGSASNFAKSTDNGANNGCADVNGLMWQVALGVTNAGANATDTATIANSTIYVLKESSFLKDLTAGWDGSTDAFGNTTHLASLYDSATSPVSLDPSESVYWGNGTNPVFDDATSGVGRALCGFLPKNDTAADATGINMLGNDQVYKRNKANLFPLLSGRWSNAAGAGVGCRFLYYHRSYDYVDASFRAVAYV